MQFAGQSNHSNILIAHNVFTDIYPAFGAYNPAMPAWGNAVDVVGNQHLLNLTVRNNVGLRLDAFFNSAMSIVGLTLDSNTVSACNGNCIGFGSVVDLVMNNSVFVRDAPHDLFLYGTTDIIVGGVSGNLEHLWMAD